MAENMTLSEMETKEVKYWNLNKSDLYSNWREKKLRESTALLSAGFVEISILSNPSDAEKAEIMDRIEKTGFALYQAPPVGDKVQIGKDLRSFTDSFGLRVAEAHRSAGVNGLVSLQVSDKEGQRGYMPYSRKGMNWHTDGYYNAPDDYVRAFALHCVRPAGDGGQSQIIDHEIAYIRLRDLNPDYVALLMDVEAMTIPANTEKDGSIRPDSVGPVFFVENGTMNMRYTARTRSISWKDDATHEAAKALQNILENETEFLHTATLAAGQGKLSNNVLHNRTGFDPNSQTGASRRLLYRIRFHNRIKGSQNGQTK